MAPGFWNFEGFLKCCSRRGYGSCVISGWWTKGTRGTRWFWRNKAFCGHSTFKCWNLAGTASRREHLKKKKKLTDFEGRLSLVKTLNWLISTSVKIEFTAACVDLAKSEQKSCAHEYNHSGWIEAWPHNFIHVHSFLVLVLHGLRKQLYPKVHGCTRGSTFQTPTHYGTRYICYQ